MKGIAKRFLALIVTLCLIILSAFPINAIAAESSGFTYEIVSGSTSVRITGYSSEESNVVIPDILDGRTVVEISAGAFADNYNIKNLTISSNVLRIMREAFKGCSSLETVVIPASVSSIGDSAFAQCTALNSVTINSASTAIGYYAFEGCTALKEITIPSVKISDSAFKNCSSLEKITLLDSVQTVGKEAFDGTAWYKTQPQGLMILDSVLYKYTGTDSAVYIPESVKCIADYAFSGSDVSSVILPDRLYYIGNYALSDCENLKYISIPDTVISIGTKAIGYSANVPVDGFVIYCRENSVAGEWAVNNGFSVEFTDNCLHEYSQWTIISDASCTSDGQRSRICIKCNDIQTEVIPASGHSWSGFVTISELTCTQDGIERRTCTICGETEDKVTPASGHQWSEWTTIKEASCTEEGERTHKCSVCGLEESEKIEKNEHEWDINENTDADGWITNTAPTCTEPGSKERVCTICGTVEKSEIEPTGHYAEVWILLKEPTALSAGLKQGKCVYCGETFTEDIPPVSEELPDDVTMLSLKDNSSLYFNETRTYVLGADPESTVEKILNEFNYPGHILVSDIKLNTLENYDTVGTGCFVFLVKYNEDTQKYDPIDTMCIIVRGDVNGDGGITAADARIVLRAAANLESLNAAYTTAADLTGDGKLTAAEARRILRVASKIDSAASLNE